MADHAVAQQGTDRVRAGIRKVISHYKQHFTEADQGERYKWEVIGWYKKHWDINASDFSAIGSFGYIFLSYSSNLSI